MGKITQSENRKKTGNNKYITPVDLEVIKEVPNLQKVGLDGTSPISTGALSQSYKLMLKTAIDIEKDLSNAKEENLFYEARNTLNDIRRTHELEAIQEYPVNYKDDPELVKKRLAGYNEKVVQPTLENLAYWKDKMPTDKYYHLEEQTKTKLYEDSERLVTMQKNAELTKITTDFKIREAQMPGRVYDLFHSVYKNTDDNMPESVRAVQFEADIDDMNIGYVRSGRASLVHMSDEAREAHIAAVLTGNKTEALRLVMEEPFNTQHVMPGLRRIVTDLDGNPKYDENDKIMYVQDPEGGFEIDVYKLKMHVNTTLDGIRENLEKNIAEDIVQYGLNPGEAARYQGEMIKQYDVLSAKLRDRVARGAEDETNRRAQRKLDSADAIAKAEKNGYNGIIDLANTHNSEVPHATLVNKVFAGNSLPQGDTLTEAVVHTTYNITRKDLIANKIVLTGIGEKAVGEILTKTHANIESGVNFSETLQTETTKYLADSADAEARQLKKGALLLEMTKRGIPLSEKVLDAVIKPVESRSDEEKNLVSIFDESVQYDKLFGSNDFSKMQSFTNIPIERGFKAIQKEIQEEIQKTLGGDLDHESFNYALKKLFLAGQHGSLHKDFTKSFAAAYDTIGEGKAIGHNDPLAQKVIAGALYDFSKKAPKDSSVYAEIKTNMMNYRKLKEQNKYTAHRMDSKQIKLLAAVAAKNSVEEEKQKQLIRVGEPYVKQETTKPTDKQQDLWNQQSWD